MNFKILGGDHVFGGVFVGESVGGVIFTYQGRGYNRPCQRGVCLGPGLEELAELLPEGDMYFEIVVRQIVTPNANVSRDEHREKY